MDDEKELTAKEAAGNCYELKIENDTIKILINGAIHLAINRRKLLGVQSWIINANTLKFWIEYTLDGGVMLSSYDESEKWKSILKLLNENVLFSA